MEVTRARRRPLLSMWRKMISLHYGIQNILKYDQN